MKKFIFAILTVAALGCVALTSCSKDDDKDKTTNTNNGGGEPQVSNVQINDYGDRMTCTFTASYGTIVLNYEMEALFQNDMCYSCVLKTICPTAEMAAAYYNDILNDPEENPDLYSYQQGSNIIVYDMTEDVSGFTKAQVRVFFEAYAAVN